MEDIPPYQKVTEDGTPTLKAYLWPEGSPWEGKTIDTSDPSQMDIAYPVVGEPEDFEAQIEAWSDSTQPFYVEAVQSLKTVLEEHYLQLAAQHPNELNIIRLMSKDQLLSEAAEHLASDQQIEAILAASWSISEGEFTLSELAHALNFIAAPFDGKSNLAPATIAALRIAGKL